MTAETPGAAGGGPAGGQYAASGPPPPPAYQPPPRRTSPWLWGGGFAFAGCLVLVVLFFIVLAALGSLITRGGAPTVTGSTTSPIVLIRVDGVITAGESSAGLTGTTTGSDDVVKQIEDAAYDPGIKAILLRVNSPGGSAAGSQEIYDAVARARQRGKKVVVSMADVAASGGYYISCDADRIFADAATMTGSIGVITEHEDFSGLLNKVGVKVDTIKSGKLKDMLSPTRPLQPEERQVMQTIIMQIYGQFVQAVAKGRKLDPAVVRHLGDGRVYTGIQAKQLKLIDELGGFRKALDWTAQAIHLRGRPTYRTYAGGGLLRRLFGSAAESRASGVQASSDLAVPGGLLYDDRAARLVGGAVLERMRER